MKQLTKETPELLPPACLPESPFNSLLTFSYDQKMNLFDYLGLRDLASDMRLIIEKPKLSLIASFLSEDKRKYMNRLRKTKEPVTFKPMNLSKWDGTGTTLMTLIRQRGLNRAAKALY